MAKGQRRSNRELKKPKQRKPERGGALPLATVPTARELMPGVGGRPQSGARKGRR
jgi:hypothetical protein